MPNRGARKRALLVNCYVDETRRGVARSFKIPQTLGPVFLAGWLAPDRWDIRIHNELSDGPCEDPDLLGWPDLLILTGLISSLDRMRQVAAYARTRNPKVVVVGGGHLARAFPRFCATFMDVVCQGDVEEIAEVVAGMFGPEYAAEAMVPRFDLGHWIGPVGHVESSRYCNFRCSFCILTAEGRRYRPDPVDHLDRQFQAQGRKRIALFIDNNFYGSDRESFRERVACAGRHWRSGTIGSWSALVTADFFRDPANLALARDEGCIALFSGVESFDPGWNALVNKRQNTGGDQVQMIADCLEAGVVFLYGMILDINNRRIADLRRELDFVIGCDRITLPGFLSLPIPLPGTPYFYECLDAGRMLPHTKVRDLDSTTICVEPLDPLDEAQAFVRDLQTLRGYRTRVLRHGARFAWRYRRHLTPLQHLVAVTNSALAASPLAATLPRRVGRRIAPRTVGSTTEPLDRFYQPAFRVDGRWADHFRPVMLTDGDRHLSPALAEDLEASRPARRTRAVAAAG